MNQHRIEGPSQSAAFVNPFSVGLILTAIRHWWMAALPVGLVLAATAAVALYLTHVPEYRATAMVRIEPFRQSIVYDSRQAVADSRRFVENQLQLIRSDLVLEPVLANPKVAQIPELQSAGDAGSAIRRRISVSSIGRSDFYHIGFTGLEPVSAATLANLITNEYMKIRGDFEQEQIERIIKILEEQRADRHNELLRRRELVSELTKNATGRDPFGPATQDSDAGPQKLATLQSRLVTAEVNLAMQKANLSGLNLRFSKENVSVDLAELNHYIASNEELNARKELIEQNKFKLKETERLHVSGKNSTEYKRLAERIEEDKQQLKERQEEIRQSIYESLVEDAQRQREAATQQLENDIANSETTIVVLTKQFEEELKAAQQYTSETLFQLEIERRELNRVESVMDELKSRMLAIQTEREAPGRVTLLREAKAPLQPVEVVPLKKMAFAAAGAMCLPFGLAVLWELRVRRVDNLKQIEQSSKLPVVGEIAHLPTRNRGGVEQDLWLFEESVDSLRTNLTLSEPRDELQVIAVTSAASQEGKTSVASQLAVSLARASNAPTLLIDGDMRSPDINNVFGIDLEPGLANILDGESTADDAIITDWSATLDLLPAGFLKCSPHRLVGGNSFKGLLDSFRQKYRYIVIDTPPVLSASESMVLARHSDASIVCARRNMTREDQLRRVFRKLHDAGANPTGVVLNGVPSRRYAYTYGKYQYAKQSK